MHGQNHIKFPQCCNNADAKKYITNIIIIIIIIIIMVKFYL